MGAVTAKKVEQRLFIGVDGGGTKTEFVLFAENGEILRRIVREASNPNSVGIEKSCEILKEGIECLSAGVGGIYAIFVGVSGATSGDNQSLLNAFLQKTFPTIKTRAHSDIMNVIASATDTERCVAAISGTGASVFAYENGNLTRFGGWGYLLDEGGSGYDIGKDALRAVLAERDGFGEKTLLTPIIEEKLQGTVWENIHKIYAGGIRYIASFATCVFEAYGRSDKVAEGILRKNMLRLSELIGYAAERCDSGNVLVLAGGIFNQKETVLRFLKESLDEKLQIVIPDLPQIYGACVQSLRLGCIAQTRTFKERFATDYKKSNEVNVC